MLKTTLVSITVAIFLSACTVVPQSNLPADVTPTTGPSEYTWKPRLLPAEPSVDRAVMCYDSRRGVCVLYGGSRSAPDEECWVPNKEIYEFDGKAWLKRDVTGRRPEGLTCSSMAFDDGRGECVLCGWVRDPNPDDRNHRRLEAWTWNGKAWKEASAGLSDAPAYIQTSMAYDPIKGVCVLLAMRMVEKQWVADTWTWDRETWTMAPPADDSECPQSPGEMVFDGLRGETCACAGADLYFWNGKGWKREYAESEAITGFQGLTLIATDAKSAPFLVCSKDGSTQVFELLNKQWQRCTRLAATPCTLANACWDAKRKQLVVRGGWPGFDETWLTNARGSVRVAGRPSPPSSYHSAMCFDEKRGVGVLAVRVESGFEIWEWNGNEWNCARRQIRADQLSYLACAAFDRRRGVSVLAFADRHYASNVAVYEWDGKALVEGCPEPGPEPLRGWAMVYDDNLGEALLLGGAEAEGYADLELRTVWSWNGSRWSRRVDEGCTASPIWANFAYDSKRKRVIALGCTDDPRFDADAEMQTWEYDGTRWTLQAQATGLSPRIAPMLVYDPMRELMLCFGGCEAMQPISCSADCRRGFDSMWQWTGGQWQALPCKIRPAGRGHAAAAFDSKRGVVVMTGGAAFVHLFRETWEFGPDD